MIRLARASGVEAGASVRLSDRGLRLIGEFEGFSPTPYDDPAGHCTVGYGELLHLGACTPEELAQPPITEAQGLTQLAEKAQHYGDAVESMSRLLNQNEYDALTSLCYNIGVGGYARSSVRAAVNSGGNVCLELRRYVKGTDGVTYPGLVRRREAECALFNEPEDDMGYTKAETDAKVGALLLQVGKLGADLRNLTSDVQGTFRYAYAHATDALLHTNGVLPRPDPAELQAKIDELQRRLDTGADELRQAARALGGE